MKQVIDWLLSGEPWVAYRTRIDLLGESENESNVREVRQAMLTHPGIVELLDEVAEWPGPILKSHKSAGHLLHKLVFLADLGLQETDTKIRGIINRIKEHRSVEGLFQIKANISIKYGGTGEDEFVWMLCDAPLVLYALVKFGLQNSEDVRKAVGFLQGLERENGYPCTVAPELGKFRGPGRKADPCPYANLLMIKLLEQFPQYYEGENMRIGAETLLTLWEQRKESRPYLFAMGSGFVKLKAPFVWYDILHVTDVLSQIPWVRSDKRFVEMMNIIQSKADAMGRYTPESVWRDWKGWDFGQKKEPSRWITFLTMRMLQRIDTVKVL